VSARTGQAERWPLLVQGAAPALVALGLAVASYVGVVPLAVAVLAVQVFLVLAVLALLDAPASGGAFVVATGALVAADAVVLREGSDVGGLAGVLGLAVVACLLHQLTRRKRSRVTESLADTLVCVVMAMAATCLLAVRQLDDGDQAVRIALVAAAAARWPAGSATARVPADAGRRLDPGWPGPAALPRRRGGRAVLAVGDGEIRVAQAALLGLVVAATVAAADLAIDLGAAELRPTRRDARRVAALRPAGLLLPFAALGPVVLVASRLVLG
jgi:hypothetical protein